jgi:hypothetical protein
MVPLRIVRCAETQTAYRRGAAGRSRQVMPANWAQFLAGLYASGSFVAGFRAVSNEGENNLLSRLYRCSGLAYPVFTHTPKM